MPRRALLLPVLSATIASLVVLSVWLAVRRQEEQSIARQMDLSAVEVARRLEDFIASRLTVVQAIREERAAGLMRALTEAGYEVIEASNGEEALHLLEGPPPGPDLLISDLVMPRMGGLELAERLRDKHPTTRLLLTSGHPDERVDSHRLRQLGASFLPKPYTTRRFLELVRRVLDE